MNIAILSRWNSACGVSLHSELIGREFVKNGHKLTVFAPDNIRPIDKDENYVVRCCSDGGDHNETFFNPEPFLENDYEILVIQRLEWVPLEPLKKIYPEIKKKAKIIYVVHERKLPLNRLFYDFSFDAVICFDERYKQQWVKKYKDICIIPYPVGYLKGGDKRASRKELSLPEDKKIIFSYGWAPELHIFPILPSLKDLHKNLPFLFLILADPKYIKADLQKFKGALTPIMTSNTEFVWFLNKEIVKYSNEDEFKNLTIKVFGRDKIVDETLKAAEAYTKRYSPDVIADEFIKLFSRLLTKS
jgi:glycosyltransferase involved in cell wall biosynthesis